MVRYLSAALILLTSVLPVAADPDLAGINRRAVADHIKPSVSLFQSEAAQLAQAADANCRPDSADLIAAFHASVDAWTRMSHLRFGPTETDDRAFALAFWPDGRGKTPKGLVALLQAEGPALSDPDAFKQNSIAVRGLYALEFALFDETTLATGTDEARCELIQAIARDVASNASGIAKDWVGYADLLVSPSEGALYRSDAEATQELFKALATGLQFTSDTRLGRPLGTFDRPRPKRAEMWRSGRSLRQIEMSLLGTRDLARVLAVEMPGISERLDALYEAALTTAADLDDPIFAGVAEIQGRLRVDILKISIDQIRELVALELGPALGVAEGFNALDGD